MILFPAIDLKDGRCVRLEQGDMARATVFNRDPAAQAHAFEAQGFEYLHVVDLDGAFAGKPVNAAAVERILETRRPSRCSSAAASATWRRSRAGSTRASAASSSAPRRCAIPAFVQEAAQRLSRAASRSGSTRATARSRSRAGRKPRELSALDIARRFEDAGVAAIIYTDIARDGMLKGLNLDATIALADADLDPGDRLGRPRLARRHQGAARRRARRSSQAPSPAARSTTGGSIRRRRSTLIRAAQDGGLMFKVRVIPCLDVKDGRVVKGVNFVDLRDAGDPVEAAIAYDAAGADELCFLDITASHENRGTILDVVRAHRGGLLHAADRRRRRAHASRTSARCCSPAPTRSRSTPRRWRGRDFVKEAAEKFGDQCIVVAIDAKKVSKPGEPDRWEIFTHGGRKPTGIDAVAYAREVVALGAGEILLTSMDRDGTKRGFDIALTRAIADAVPVPVIASGGVGTLDHLVEGIRDGHATAVLAASIFHFGEHSVREAKDLYGRRRPADAARSVTDASRQRREVL